MQTLRSAMLTTVLVPLLDMFLLAGDSDLVPLFPEDGIPTGWSVREWNDLAKPVEGVAWTVKDGILQSGKRRGTWLVSEKEYSDFIWNLNSNSQSWATAAWRCGYR